MSFSLTQYPSLQDVFSNPETKIVGLYFASDWCPDCTPITQELRKLHTNIKNPQLFKVVYVSSDYTEESMMQSMKDNMNKEWSYVPFDSVDKDKLKINLGICAGKEVEALKTINRVYGIPTLVIVNKETQKILSFKGVQEIENQTEFLAKYGLS